MPDVDLAMLARRLLSRSAVTEGGCRRWTGAHIPTGYGMIHVAGKMRPVHAVAHEIWIGPIPEGYEVDHVHARGCRYRDCIEPAHLEAITHAENVRRVAALITHCPKGHEYTPENIKWRAPRKGRGDTSRTRNCRRCVNDRENRRRAAARRRQPETANA